MSNPSLAPAPKMCVPGPFLYIRQGFYSDCGLALLRVPPWVLFEIRLGYPRKLTTSSLVWLHSRSGTVHRVRILLLVLYELDQVSDRG
jgi:hypothetical protein